MKVKAGLLFIVTMVLGTIFYHVFVINIAEIIVFRCFFATVAVYLIGDFFSHYVLRLPIFNYTNIFIYIKRELLGQIGFMFVFSFAWCYFIVYLTRWGADSLLEQLILTGGFIPSLYYLVNHIRYFNTSDRENRRMKRKL
ncbi:hypothetical protein IMX26_11600 [Clostridium sp. 'deep sea']|uniref:hypothetical protein n=1 Tax=Clostridium sp. 'deep sea' TaxID=2779445 RepID=UPI0018964583|nr:hypothetical protein [Clostridium sp. 'deep sea']QOR34134.1 hypothetical protein IMX26_11600 [Clostridium sp. 'deep sea']